MTHGRCDREADNCLLFLGTRSLVCLSSLYFYALIFVFFLHLGIWLRDVKINLERLLFIGDYRTKCQFSIKDLQFILDFDHVTWKSFYRPNDRKRARPTDVKKISSIFQIIVQKPLFLNVVKWDIEKIYLQNLEFFFTILTAIFNQNLHKTS